jgi:hypothetical protein
MAELLIPLARAVADTVARLGLDDVEVFVDVLAGTVIVAGEGLSHWGHRTVLEHALGQARLDYETHMLVGARQSRIIVRPS